MTYIVKTMSNGDIGVYDTIKGCYPIEGPELRAAGIKRVEGTGKGGWFKGKDGEAEATRIAETLNGYHLLGEYTPAKGKPKTKAAKQDDETAMRDMADRLIADEKKARNAA